MHFFSKTPSSSSMPSSPSVPSTKDNNTNNCRSTATNSWIARGQSFMIKKLERQRKPRHVSEQDLGSNLTDRPKSPSGNPGSAKKSRSPRGMDHWSSVAVPHPLPVPESLLTRRQKPLSSILGHGHLGSPEEGPNHVLRRNSPEQIATKFSKPSSNFRQRLSQNANVDSTSCDLRLKIQARSAPTSGFSSPCASPQRSNATDPFASHVASNLTKYSGHSNRVPSHDLIIEGANYKSSLISSPRSAPISGLPSPATVSPRKSYNGDFLPFFVASQESQVQPTLKIPDLGRLASHSSQVPPVKTVLSPDHSPLRSPRLQSPCVDLENKCYSRSRHKLLQGCSKEWPENSCVSAHPRSAPISGLPSPATVSPRRSYTGDFLPSFMASQESQVRPTLKIPDLGRLASHSSQVPPVKTVLSPDHSPLRSPRLQSPCVDLENKCYSRSRHKLLQGCSKEWPENSFVSAHPRSAPISGLPSPATVSPRRSYTGDFLPSFMASQESQVRPTLKIPDLGRLASHSSQVPPVKTVLSPDHSPLRSPRLQSPCSDLENKCYSRSRHKLLQGSSKEWPENSRVSAHPFPLPWSPLPHPLPLPPGAAPPQSSMPSPPTSIHNTLEKQNEPLRKNQWVKGKLIGCGSYGRVYMGTNRVTGASCAMKEVDIIPGDPKAAESVKQLEQEIRVLRDLKHPNIVQYYGCEIVDEQFYIYLEYINPGSINKYVQEHCGHLTESIVRNFTRHILSGLAYLHSKKTIHRDIKGANLLVDASGVVKLTDFGTAKHLTGLSYELSLKGSPHWMAPEVIKAVMLKSGNPELALAVDTWSLGCTIIEMVTGKPPWGDLQGAQAMFKILNKDPPIPENLSPEGKDFLRCCFRRNPAERPSAMMLLDHPFVCKSNDFNVSACREAVPAVNPVDNLVSWMIRSERLKKMMCCKPP